MEEFIKLAKQFRKEADDMKHEYVYQRRLMYHCAERLEAVIAVQQSVQSDGAVLSGCGIVFERYKDGVAVKYPLRTPRR